MRLLGCNSKHRHDLKRIDVLHTGSTELALVLDGTRRHALTKVGALLLIQLVAQGAPPARADVPYEPPTIRPSLAPKQGTFDPTDEDLRDAAALLQRALNAEEVEVGSPNSK